LDVVDCPAGHPFVISTRSNSNKQQVVFVAPISENAQVPTWLPEEYHSAYREMKFNFISGRYRSAVAVAGIILDGHINSLLKYKGDQRKSLKKRLEILADSKLIDQDQFADGTVARLGRNDTIHPEDVAQETLEKEAEEVIEAVSGCIERFYRWRRAKALPAPAEKAMDPSTTPEPEEVIQEEGKPDVSEK
jgi:hypothetical protein